MFLRSLLTTMPLLLIGCDAADVTEQEADFSRWIKEPVNQNNVEALKVYLKTHDADGVIPMEQLLRSDVRWKKCQSEPYSSPSKDQWPHIILTLHLLRDKILPLIGPVEAQSVFRNPTINHCIGGAKNSYHMQFFAIDMKPLPAVSRDILIAKLCRFYRNEGKKHNIGLGLYAGTRFHIDTAGYRSWGQDQKASSSPCQSN